MMPDLKIKALGKNKNLRQNNKIHINFGIYNVTARFMIETSISELPTAEKFYIP